jgi:hypothetical protein
LKKAWYHLSFQNGFLYVNIRFSLKMASIVRSPIFSTVIFYHMST